MFTYKEMLIWTVLVTTIAYTSGRIHTKSSCIPYRNDAQEYNQYAN
jgi:hypothetical protein